MDFQLSRFHLFGDDTLVEDWTAEMGSDLGLIGSGEIEIRLMGIEGFVAPTVGAGWRKGFWMEAVALVVRVIAFACILFGSFVNSLLLPRFQEKKWTRVDLKRERRSEVEICTRYR